MTDPSQPPQDDFNNQPPAYDPNAYPPDPYQQQAMCQYYGYQQPVIPVGHSKMGIASFVLAVISILLAIIGIVIAGILGLQYPELENMNPDHIDPELIGPVFAIFCPLCSTVMLSIVGLILGIIGATQNQQSKTFAIIGAVLNGLVILGFMGLMAIGLVMG